MPIKSKTHHYVVNDPENCMFKIHRSVFVDNDVYRMEQEKIFDKCWLYLGHKSEIPHLADFKTRQVGGRELIFNRDSEGTIRAMFNSCRHRGAVVCRERQGSANAFQCFYHSWTFDNKGKLIGIPGRDSYLENFNEDGCMDLIQVPNLSHYRGFYFVNYDQHPERLEDYLADAKEYLDLVADQSEVGMEIIGGTHEYSTNSNWKLVVENAADAYHALSTHATYFEYATQRSGLKRTNPHSPKYYQEAKRLGNGHFVIESDSDRMPWGRPVAKPAPWWPEEIKQEVYRMRQRLIERHGQQYGHRITQHNFNMVIFPNLVINNIHSIVVRTTESVSPGYHHINAWCLLPKDLNDYIRGQALDSFLEFLGPAGLATPDDNEALELAQIGYKNVKEDSWNVLSKGMNKERNNQFPMMTDDEYHIRSWWMKWDEIMSR